MRARASAWRRSADRDSSPSRASAGPAGAPSWALARSASAHRRQQRRLGREITERFGERTRRVRVATSARRDRRDDRRWPPPGHGLERAVWRRPGADRDGEQIQHRRELSTDRVVETALDDASAALPAPPASPGRHPTTSGPEPPARSHVRHRVGPDRIALRPPHQRERGERTPTQPDIRPRAPRSSRATNQRAHPDRGQHFKAQTQRETDQPGPGRDQHARRCRIGCGGKDEVRERSGADHDAPTRVPATRGPSPRRARRHHRGATARRLRAPSRPNRPSWSPCRAHRPRPARPVTGRSITHCSSDLFERRTDREPRFHPDEVEPQRTGPRRAVVERVGIVSPGAELRHHVIERARQRGASRAIGVLGPQPQADGPGHDRASRSRGRPTAGEHQGEPERRRRSRGPPSQRRFGLRSRSRASQSRRDDATRAGPEAASASVAARACGPTPRRRAARPRDRPRTRGRPRSSTRWPRSRRDPRRGGRIRSTADAEVRSVRPGQGAGGP